MFLTINLLFIAMNIFESEEEWNIVPFATESELDCGLVSQEGRTQHLEPGPFRNSLQAVTGWQTCFILRKPWFSETESYYVTLNYPYLKLWSYCVSLSSSLGAPLAFPSGPGVWQVKPCCDSGGFNLLPLFVALKDSKLIHVLIGAFAASEVLLYFSILHFVSLSEPDTIFHLPVPKKGFIIACGDTHVDDGLL